MLHLVLERAPKKDEQLDGEIKGRWIPYGVKRNASLVANSLNREELIAMLKEYDPVNAERIVLNAEKHRREEYGE